MLRRVPIRLLLRVPLPALGLALALVACTRVSHAPAARVSVPQNIQDELAPMPPRPPASAPLPALPGSVRVVPRVQSLPVPPDRVLMKVLVLAATRADPGLAATTSFLDQIGTPYDVFVATEQALTAATLTGADGVGRYQGIFLANASLAYEISPGVWGSALADAGWNILWQYERDFGVRQAAVYGNPGTFPEDYGVRLVQTVDSTTSPLHANLTNAGKQLFTYLQPSADIVIRNAYTYLSTLDASSGVIATPLLEDASGNVLAVTSTSADGRERLVLTFDNNAYLMHSQVLGYGLVDWVTKGIFLGSRKAYAGIELDDWFLATDVWDASLGQYSGEYRMTAEDVLNARALQQQLASAYTLASQLRLSFAFNGEGATPSAPASCSATVGGIDPLSSLTKCVVNDFRWVNHTYSHAYMDWTTYTESVQEIAQNRTVASAMGIQASPGYDADSLVTGDFSGLGWYNPAGPDDPGAKVDFGLEASNPSFLQAAADTDITYIASNMSVPGHRPTCFGCGIYHPLAPSLFLVPRYPTNVFYAATTPTDMLALYNALYGPAGTEPYFDHDLTYQEYLDFDTDIALMHMLAGSPYYHYMHVGNLREYAPGKTLAFDWLNTLIAKYSAIYALPLVSQDWDTLGKTVADRTSFFNAGMSGMIDWTARKAVLTSQGGGVALATGLKFGTSTVYGGEIQSGRTLAPGATFSVPLP